MIERLAKSVLAAVALIGAVAGGAGPAAAGQGAEVTRAMVDLAVERCLPSLMGPSATDASGMERLGREYQLVYMRGQHGAAYGAAHPGVVLLAYDRAPVCQVLALWAEPELMLSHLAERLADTGFALAAEHQGPEGWRTDYAATRADGARILLMATATPAPQGAPRPQAVLTVTAVKE